jgi:hypothetical protein
MADVWCSQTGARSKTVAKRFHFRQLPGACADVPGKPVLIGPHSPRPEPTTGRPASGRSRWWVSDRPSSHTSIPLELRHGPSALRDQTVRLRSRSLSMLPCQTLASWRFYQQHPRSGCHSLSNARPVPVCLHSSSSRTCCLYLSTGATQTDPARLRETVRDVYAVSVAFMAWPSSALSGFRRSAHPVPLDVWPPVFVPPPECLPGSRGHWEQGDIRPPPTL